MTSDFLIDTNVISETAKVSADPAVTGWLARQPTLEIAAVSLYELVRGVRNAPGGKHKTFLERWLALLLAGNVTIVPFDGEAALVAADVEAECRRRGRPMPERDLFILATAKSRRLCVATRNVGDFRGRGVRVFNPFTNSYEV